MFIGLGLAHRSLRILTCLRADGPEVLDVVLDPAKLLEEQVDVDHVGQDEKPGHCGQQVSRCPDLEI